MWVIVRLDVWWFGFLALPVVYGGGGLFFWGRWLAVGFATAGTICLGLGLEVWAGLGPFELYCLIWAVRPLGFSELCRGLVSISDSLIDI